jgi:hypothetical protein
MPRKSLPSYRLHKASGQAVVTLAGHDHYLGQYDSPESRQKYDQLIAEWLAGGRSAIIEPHVALTVTELLAAYWAHAETYYQKDGKPTSQQDRVKRSLGVVRDLYGAIRARDFGPVALAAVRQRMIDFGWCRRVVNQRVDCVKRAWKWAVSHELIPAGVYEALRALPGLRRGRTAAPEAAFAETEPPGSGEQPTLQLAGSMTTSTAAAPRERRVIETSTVSSIRPLRASGCTTRR